MALKTVRVPPAFGGIDLASGPAYVDQAHGQTLHNLLPGTPGRVDLRGPVWMSGLGQRPGYATKSVGGIWGLSADSSSAVLFSRGNYGISRIRPHTTAGWEDAVDLSGTTAMDYLGASYAQYAGKVYGGGHYGSANDMLVWDGGTTLTNLANAPRAPRAVAIHLDRLFVLGGSKPGTTTPDRAASLTWTDPLAGAPVPATLDAWKDDASGLVNDVILEGGDGDPGVALVRMNQQLIILRLNSVYVLTGQTPENFSIRRVLGVRGCVSTGSVVEYGGGCYYMTRDGLVWFDGVDTDVVSRPVNPRVLADNRNIAGTLCELLPGDFLAVSVPFVSGDSESYLFHIPTKSWSTYGLKPPAGPDSGVSLQVDAARWVGDPFYPVLIARNTAASGQITRSAVASAGEDSYFGSSAKSPINFEMWSRPIYLAAPGSRSQLHRVIPSYRWEGDFCPIRLQVFGPKNGSDVLLDQTLPSFPNNDGLFEDLRMPPLECFGEADMVRVVYSRDSAAIGNLPLSIYDTAIEFQEGRQRQA